MKWTLLSNKASWSRLAAYVVAMFAFALAAYARADTIPFWGDDVPATNRTSASSQTVALASGFESRLCTEADFSLATFNSRPVGAIFMIR